MPLPLPQVCTAVTRCIRTSGLVIQKPIPTSPIGLLAPKNLSAVIEIVLISRLEAEICDFEVYRPPSWFFLHPVWSDSIPTNPIGLLDPKNISAAIEIVLISRLEAEIYENLKFIGRHLGFSYIRFARTVFPQVPVDYRIPKT